MPRFHVIFFDSTNHEIDAAIVQARHPVHALLQHPWIVEIYKESWIQKNLAAEDEDSCKQNIFKMIGWSTLCVNLDEEIMKDLNGGDLSVSSQMPQN